MNSGRFLFALSTGLAAALAGTAAMAQTPTQFAVNGDWGAYAAQANGGKTCYILSAPKDIQPANLNHGKVYFMLAQHPGQQATLEPQFTVGYPFKDQSAVELDIDGRVFRMFTEGKNAWLENAAEEPAVVDAMRAGKKMQLRATSRRGTSTSYTISLSGVTASLKEIQNCK